MYRFKSSKYKNATPKVPKKSEGWVLNISVGAPQSFGNHVKASALFKAFNVDIRSGGSLGILHLDDTGKRNKNCPLLHAHSDCITDFDFCPYDDGLLATCSNDSTVKVWRIPEVGISEGSLPNPEIVLQVGRSRVESVVFNPAVDCVMATATERTLHLWDLAARTAITSNTRHEEVIQCMSWKSDGSQIVSTGRDRKLRIWDPRSHNKCLEASSHANDRDSRVLWLGNTEYVLSTGLGSAREREVVLRDSRCFDTPCARNSGESAMGVFIPLYDPDTNMLFLVAKGDNTLNFWELTFREPFLTEASKYIGEVQAKGAGLVPKRALKVMDGEVNRVLLLGQECIVPVSYQVPRKSYRDFHADIFPDTAPASPTITTPDWQQSRPPKMIPKVSLDPEKRPTCGLVRINHQLGTGPVVNIEDEPHEASHMSKREELFKMPLAPPTPAPRRKAASRLISPTSRERSQSVISNRTISLGTASLRSSMMSTSSGASTPVAAPRTTGLARRESSRYDGRGFKVRVSKFRHLTGSPGHRATHITNLPPLCKTVPGESEGFRANTERLAVPLAIPGGHVAVLELSKRGRLQSGVVPSLICGTSVMDFAWDPFDNSRIAIAYDDARVLIWTIPEGGLTESLTKPDMELKGHTEKVLFIKFHPTALDVLATVSHDMSLIIWDLASQQGRLRLFGHTDQIFGLAWHPDGTTLAMLCKDQTLRVYDPRNSDQAIREGPGPSGTRGGRVAWVLAGTHIVTSGFNKVSERQVSLYDATDISVPLTTEGIDVSPAILIPFYDEDSSTLFLTGKGDSTIFTFEVAIDPPYFFPLSHYKCSGPHQAVCFLPKVACCVSDVEFATAFRLTGTAVEPLSFRVPRIRSQLFQDDLFPDTRVTWEPAVTSDEWFAGEDGAVRTISLRPAGMGLLSDLPKPTLAYGPRGTSDVTQDTTRGETPP